MNKLREKAAKLAAMYKEVSENEGAYFEYNNPASFAAFSQVDGSPDSNSDLCRWRVVIPPKLKAIDLSLLIDSGIDCEFSSSSEFSYSAIAQLKEIKNDRPFPYRTKRESDLGSAHCRPRLNHPMVYKEGMKLPEGLKTKWAYIEVCNGSGNVVVGNVVVGNVVTKRVAPPPEKAAAFFVTRFYTSVEILGCADGYCWNIEHQC